MPRQILFFSDRTDPKAWELAQEFQRTFEGLVLVDKMSPQLDSLELVAKHRVVTVPTCVILERVDSHEHTLARLTGGMVTPHGLVLTLALLATATPPAST